MEKINIAELLQKCPKGMELYSPIFGEVYLDKIRPHLAIVVTTDKEQGDFKEEFLYDGRYGINGVCMLFPSKGKTTWEGFVPPCEFKDGDILYVRTSNQWICIYKEGGEKENVFHRYVAATSLIFVHDDSALCHRHNIEEIRLATEEEKQKLFDVIKANGYKWNAETKTLEKLIEPKFKVGDKIKIVHKEDYRYIITQVTDTHYTIRETDEGFLYTEPITEDENWELVSNKFDITTLKPFDKVLVRDSDKDMWCASIFSHTWKDKYFCVGAWHNQCISYEANKELLGTTHNPEEYGSR